LVKVGLLYLKYIPLGEFFWVCGVLKRGHWVGGVGSVDPPFLAFPLRGKEIRIRTCVLISFPLRGVQGIDSHKAMGFPKGRSAALPLGFTRGFTPWVK